MSFTYLLTHRAGESVSTCALSHTEQYTDEQYRTIVREAISEVVLAAKAHGEEGMDPKWYAAAVRLVLTGRFGFQTVPHEAHYIMSFSKEAPTPPILH